MKIKILIFHFFIFAVSLISCSDNINNPTLESETNKSRSVDNLRSKEDVLMYAEQALVLADINSDSIKEIDIRNSKIVTFFDDKTGSTNNPILHIVNYEKDGFAIISAVNYVVPILGVSPQGSIDGINEIENEGLAEFIEKAKNYVMNSIQNYQIEEEMQNLAINSPQVDRYIRDTISKGPFVTVNWGQRFPEGIYAPNGLSGCGATAAAQALSYCEFPDTINITYTTSSPNVLYLNWPAMKTYVNSQNTHPSSLNRYEIMLGKLCRELGHRMESHYDTIPSNLTWTYVSKVHQTLSNIINNSANYSITNYYCTLPDVPNEIGYGLGSGVVYMRSSDASDLNGHFWLIDGYKTIKTYDAIIIPDGNGSYTLGRGNLIRTDYYDHANWGWCGNGNGYYYHGVYDLTNINNTNISYNYYYFTISTGAIKSR